MIIDQPEVKLKILVAINSLDSGGAEKSALKLAEGLLADGNEVIFLTFTETLDFYEVPSQLRRVTLDNFNKQIWYSRFILLFPGRLQFWWLQAQKLVELRKRIRTEKPDCVISISASVAVFMFISTIFMRQPQIGSERINPDSKIWSHGKIVDILRPFIYHHGVSLSVQTFGVKEWCLKEWHCESIITPNHLTWLPPAKVVTSDTSVSKNKKDKIVLAIGRDHPQKNFDFLLRAWSYYESIGGQEKLVIVGPADPERLQGLVGQLGIRNAIVDARTVDLSPYFLSAKLLVSSSQFEGFPNVILEGLSFGLPVLATPSCDQISDFEAKGCCVVADSNSISRFAVQLQNLVDNKLALEQMSIAAVEVSKTYTWINVRESWYDCIKEAVAKVAK